MDRIELVKTLELVKPALASVNIIPIFQCFTFNQGEVSAYDDKIAIIAPCEFEGTAGIHGAALLGLLSNSSAEDVEFDVRGDLVTIKLGKSISKFPSSSEENFIFEVPDIKNWDFTLPLTISTFEALQLCLETVSSDETQVALHGITISKDKMYSCDGDSVTRIQLKQGIKGAVMLPTPFCEAIVKLWPALELTKGTISGNGEWLFASLGEWSVYGRMLESPDFLLDIEAEIKNTIKTKTELQAIPEGFFEALSRAQVLTNFESQKTVIKVNKGKLNLLTETAMGEISDNLTFKNHPDVTANVNASHIRKAVKVCDQIAFHDNCVVLEKAPDIFMLVSNMEE